MKLISIASNRWDGATVFVVALVTMAVGIAAEIGLRHLWLDEAAVALLAQQPLNRLHEVAVETGQSVLYAYLIAGWARVWGDGAVALRSFSAVWALGVIILIYRVGRDILHNRQLALVGVVLASTNYFLLWFAVQAKLYTLAAFMGLLSFYLWYQLTRERRWSWAGAYIISMALALYVHPWLTLVFGAHLLMVLLWFWTQRRIWWLVLAAHLAVAVLGIPNVMILWRQQALGVSTWIPPVTNMTLIETVRYFSYGNGWWYALLSVGAVLWYGNDKYWQRARGQGKRLSFLPYVYLLSYLLVPLLAAWLVSLKTPIYVVGRYEIIVLPAFILLLAALWTGCLPGRWLAALLLPLLVINFAVLVKNDRIQVQSYASTDETVAKYIDGVVDEHDVVITTDLSWATMAYYLSRVRTATTPSYRLVSYPAELADHFGWQNMDAMLAERPRYVDESARLASELRSDQTVQRIWVVYRANNPLNETLLRQLTEYFVTDEIYQPPPPRAPAWFDFVIRLRRKASAEKGKAGLLSGEGKGLMFSNRGGAT